MHLVKPAPYTQKPDEAKQIRYSHRVGVVQNTVREDCSRSKASHRGELYLVVNGEKSMVCRLYTVSGRIGPMSQIHRHWTYVCSGDVKVRRALYIGQHILFLGGF